MHEVLVLCGWPANLRSGSSIGHDRPASTNGRCIEDVSVWMSSNRLCLNPSKTELIWLGSSRRLQNCATDTEMSVLGSLIRPVSSVRDLGMLINSGLTLSDYVNKVAALCYFPIWQLRIVRRTLTNEVSHSLVWAIIHNRIDTATVFLSSQFEIPRWEATVSAPCSRQACSRTVQSQEWSLSWLSWLTSRFTVGLQSTCLPTCVPVSCLPGCSHLRSADQWTMLVPRNTLWQSALWVFTVRVLAFWTHCCVSLWLWFVTGDFQAEIETSFVYLIISCTSVNLVNCLLTFSLYSIAPRAHTWFLISLCVWNV